MTTALGALPDCRKRPLPDDSCEPPPKHHAALPPIQLQQNTNILPPITDISTWNANSDPQSLLGTPLLNPSLYLDYPLFPHSDAHSLAPTLFSQYWPEERTTVSQDGSMEQPGLAAPSVEDFSFPHPALFGQPMALVQSLSMGNGSMCNGTEDVGAGPGIPMAIEQADNGIIGPNYGLIDSANGQGCMEGATWRTPNLLGHMSGSDRIGLLKLKPGPPHVPSGGTTAIIANVRLHSDAPNVSMDDVASQQTPLPSHFSFQSNSTLTTVPNTLEAHTKGIDPDKVSFHEDSSGDTIPTLSAHDCNGCFGVISISASARGRNLNEFTPVVGRVNGDMLMLHFKESNKYAGLIVSSALVRLVREYSSALEISLSPQEKSRHAAPGKGAKLKSSKNLNSGDCTARVIVYGMKDQAFEIAHLLSDAGLFLQQPHHGEFSNKSTYFNPHLLIRPEGNMPTIESSTVSSRPIRKRASGDLDEPIKSQYTRIFDSANCGETLGHVQQSRRLQTSLISHQISALAVMIEREHGIAIQPSIPSLWRTPLKSDESSYRHIITGEEVSRPNPLRGGILADDMGLGKTLSLLALVCSHLDVLDDHAMEVDKPLHDTKTTLIVAPKSTLIGWYDQVKRHIKPGRLTVAIYHGRMRRSLVPELQANDVVITTYETLRQDWMAKAGLHSESWCRVVLDEAHRIRSRSSQVFKAACALSAQYRWCLTGTPIHNSLDDYGALLGFLQVPSLAEKRAFSYWISNPMKQNRRSGLARLQDLVRATCLRRTKDWMIRAEALTLPGKLEVTHEIRLSGIDQDLYRFFKLKASKIASNLGKKGSQGKGGRQKEENILSLINVLRLICNHGEQLLPASALDAWSRRDSSSINWESLQSMRTRCASCCFVAEETEFPKAFSCGHAFCSVCIAQFQETEEAEESNDGDVRVCLKCPRPVTGTREPRYSESGGGACIFPASAKVEALLQDLRREERQPASVKKSVVFSCWTKMLDVVQSRLQDNEYVLARIDGRSTLDDRRAALQKFNTDERCTVMLATIGSAGEGIDLTAACHVYLLEPQWNPMNEAQAVDRVHRIGQKQDVRVTRYITCDSIEEYVQWIQKGKLRLISQSLDDAGISQLELDNERWKRLLKTLVGDGST